MCDHPLPDSNRQMKCLVVSDLHYALKQFGWAIAVAADFDVVVAGDHLDISMRTHPCTVDVS